MFELPTTADLGAVMAELAKLRQWVTAGGAPIGVEVSELVGCIRQCLNLPVLTPAADVFAATDSLLAALAEEEPPASARAEGLAAKRVSSSNPTKPSAKSSAVALGRNVIAMHPALAKLLAKIAAAGFQLGRASTDEDAVEAILELFAKHKATLEGGAGATQGLQAVLAALGVEDVDGATKKIAEMFKSVDQLEKAMPELKALRETQESTEDEAAEKDVGDAMKAHRMPETARPALVAMRTGGLSRDKAKTLSPEESRAFLAGRKAAREKFAAAYAVKAEAAGLLGAAYPNPASGANGAPVEMRRTHPESDTRIVEATGIDGRKVLDISGLDGRNRFERALTYVEQHDPKAKTYTRPEKFSAARRLLQQSNVVTGD
jgi:hypothetical protein